MQSQNDGHSKRIQSKIFTKNDRFEHTARKNSTLHANATCLKVTLCATARNKFLKKNN
jgi:hypothetical protein